MMDVQILREEMDDLANNRALIKIVHVQDSTDLKEGATVNMASDTRRAEATVLWVRGHVMGTEVAFTADEGAVENLNVE